MRYCVVMGLNSIPHTILSKPLAAFPQNHRGKNGHLKGRNESCRKDDIGIFGSFMLVGNSHDF